MTWQAPAVVETTHLANNCFWKELKLDSELRVRNKRSGEKGGRVRGTRGRGGGKRERERRGERGRRGGRPSCYGSRCHLYPCIPTREREGRGERGGRKNESSEEEIALHY